MATRALELPQYPLYSTTFSIHRLSPLWHGQAALDNAALQSHASRFRDILAGDVLRGVRVGLDAEDGALARVGALRRVVWRLLREEEDWQVEGEDTQMEVDTAGHERPSIGIHIEITYEKGLYTAFLLHQNGGPAIAQPGFSYYPLMLTRMPGALRESLFDYISANFDSRASAMKLTSGSLVSSLEKYITDITTNENGPLETSQANETLRTTLKDILVSITFNLPSGSSSIKAIDITIPRDDIWPMVTRGRRLRPMMETTEPLITALAHYINGHLALDINDGHVSISKVACGAFVLGAEGRIKLFPSPRERDEEGVQIRATKTLLSSLIELAKTSRMAKEAIIQVAS
ncbi:MAG: hypothetical protein M1818_004296 [Claussenomyces sp. TS43310]|nr:MAG: hypothetical protein M1818_004296 [Claussenomyces sp. TS43310]